MKAKKILYITPGLNIGGAEKFIITLANALSADTSSQTIVSLTPQNALEHELKKDIQFVALERHSKLDLVPLMKLRKLIKMEKPDVIFCINFFTYFFVRCALFLTGNKSRRIISYHSTIHVSRKEYWMHKFYKKLLTKKDLIVTVSRNQEKYTADELGLPLSKFRTIYNGIDTDYWKPPVEGFNSCLSTRKNYNIPADAQVIVKAASFRVEKNHIGAVKALQLLHNQYQCRAYLLLLGDGLMMREVQKLAKESGLEEYVIFTGMISNVQPYLWASDVFTLCSTSVETFSIAALEAMASGLPCVLTDIGGASEMIVEGRTGYLCTPDEKDIAEKWHRVLTGNFSKDEIYDHVATRFSANKMIEEYKEIL